MLKITLHDSADEFRLCLEGKLSGPWVGELRQCWQTASSTTQGRRTVLDLREVDFVDAAGESLLCDMSALRRFAPGVHAVHAVGGGRDFSRRGLW